MVAALLLVLVAPAPRALAQVPPSKPSLKQAVQLLDELEDEKAASMFREMLRHAPKAPAAAQCHMYLGIIALNALDVEGARAEFKKAVSIDPTLELPVNAAPKARMVFEQAQTEVAQSGGGVPQRGGPASVVVVTNAPPAKGGAPELAVNWTPEPPNHVPAYIAGGVGAAAFVVGLYFGALLSNQTQSQAQASPVAATAEAMGKQVGTQRLIADVFYGAAVVGLGTGVALFLTEKPSTPSGAPAASLVPVPGGGVFSFGGRF